ncbi:Helitron helicase-like domain-containing protein [Strongyloides ratti]|uniref:Helitron helicase-like domain-containing protein n=1 Tax=Strongyloides ratti TaxID=34506 RepID=A0A090L1H6_STRRB|nr:Helitron helicase-like domain-containing protein [Strongyloides ratti]CEF61319.1 Helitron helicase-like domain-containing protein [Strongyloides ratti]
MYRKPDLFITFKCFKTTDKPDIVVRVFSMKFYELITMLKKGFFGKEQHLFYSVEVQKKRLPHAHILLKIKNFQKSSSNIDKIVCAELPDQKKDPHLFDYVVRHMLHQNCMEMNEKFVCWRLSKNKCSNIPQSKIFKGNDIEFFETISHSNHIDISKNCNSVILAT